MGLFQRGGACASWVCTYVLEASSVSSRGKVTGLSRGARADPVGPTALATRGQTMSVQLLGQDRGLPAWQYQRDMWRRVIERCPPPGQQHQCRSGQGREPHGHCLLRSPILPTSHWQSPSRSQLARDRAVPSWGSTCWSPKWGRKGEDRGGGKEEAANEQRPTHLPSVTIR